MPRIPATYPSSEPATRTWPWCTAPRTALPRPRRPTKRGWTSFNNHAKAEAAYQQSLALHEAILRDHPKVVAFRMDVGICYGNMAMHVRRSRSPEESLPWTARAIDIVAPVLEKEPLNRRARGCLFDAHFGRAIALRELGRPDEAAKDWKRALELSAR